MKCIARFRRHIYLMIPFVIGFFFYVYLHGKVMGIATSDLDKFNCNMNIFVLVVNFIALAIIIIVYCYQYLDANLEHKVIGYEQYIRDIIGGFSIKYKNPNAYSEWKYLWSIIVKNDNNSKNDDNNKIFNNTDIKKLIDTMESVQKYIENGIEINYKLFVNKEIIEFLVNHLNEAKDLYDNGRDKKGEIYKANITQLEEHVNRLKEKEDEITAVIETCFIVKGIYDSLQFGYIDGLMNLLQNWKLCGKYFFEHISDPKYFDRIAERMGIIEEFRYPEIGKGDVYDFLKDEIAKLEFEQRGGKPLEGLKHFMNKMLKQPITMKVDIKK